MTPERSIITESLGGPAAIAVDGLVLMLPPDPSTGCDRAECAKAAKSLRDAEQNQPLPKKLCSGA